MKLPKSYKPPKSSGNKVFKFPKLYELAEWVAYSKRFLQVNPKCYACGEKSHATDHIIAHKNDLELFWNETNHIPLCETCHNTITPLFDRFNPPKTEEKMIWINGKRIQTGTVLKVKVISKAYERKPV